MSLAGDLQGIVSGIGAVGNLLGVDVPTDQIQGLAGGVASLLSGQLPSGDTLSKFGDLVGMKVPQDLTTFFDQAAKQGLANAIGLGDSVPQILDLAGLPEGILGQTSGLGLAGAKGQFLIGDVLVAGGKARVASNEDLSVSLDTTEYPAEEGQDISTHAHRNPLQIKVTGFFGGKLDGTERKKSVAQLMQYWYDARLLDVVCDFPPGLFELMVIKSMGVNRAWPWQNVNKLDILLEQKRLTRVPGTGDGGSLSINPGGRTGTGQQTNLGRLGMNGINVPISPGAKGSDGGLGGLLGGILGGVADLAGGALGVDPNVIKGAANTLINGDFGSLINGPLGSMLAGVIPGGEMAKSILSGKFGVDSLLKGVASFIPGGGLIADIVDAGIHSGAIGAGLDLVGEQLGIDLTKTLGSGFDKDAFAEHAISNLVGAVVDQVAGGNPILKDVGGALANWMLGEASTTTVADRLLGMVVGQVPLTGVPAHG